MTHSEVEPAPITLTGYALTTVMSGVPGFRDVLSPSPASFAAHFLRVGNGGREL